MSDRAKPVRNGAIFKNHSNSVTKITETLKPVYQLVGTQRHLSIDSCQSFRWIPTTSSAIMTPSIIRKLQRNVCYCVCFLSNGVSNVLNGNFSKLMDCTYETIFIKANWRRQNWIIVTPYRTVFGKAFNYYDWSSSPTKWETFIRLQMGKGNWKAIRNQDKRKKSKRSLKWQTAMIYHSKIP